MNPQYWFQTDNKMYWSNDYTTDVMGNSATSIGLTPTNDSTNLFEMNSTGNGGGEKYLVAADGTYLQWAMSDPLAVIQKSKYTIQTGLPSGDDLIHLTFVYQAAAGITFRLRVGTQDKVYVKLNFWLKRVLGGSFEYIVAQENQDQFGIFTPIYHP